jgi:hypothetical protein
MFDQLIKAYANGNVIDTAHVTTTDDFFVRAADLEPRAVVVYRKPWRSSSPPRRSRRQPRGENATPTTGENTAPTHITEEPLVLPTESHSPQSAESQPGAAPPPGAGAYCPPEGAESQPGAAPPPGTGWKSHSQLISLSHAKCTRAE